MYEYIQCNPCDITQNSQSRHEVSCKPLKLALSCPHTFWGLTSLRPNISTYLHRLTFPHPYIHLYPYILTFLPTSLHPYLHLYISLYPYIPTYIHLYLYILTSLPTSLHSYIPTFLHHYIPTYLHTPISLPPYFPTALPPRLPASLPPCLPTSIIFIKTFIVITITQLSITITWKRVIFTI